jgi:hypothetical protein
MKNKYFRLFVNRVLAVICTRLISSLRVFNYTFLNPAVVLDTEIVNKLNYHD